MSNNDRDINKHYVDVKVIKKNTQLPDTYFVSKFGFSPYKACQHACKYCDGRSEKYYVEGDFEKDIVIRQNLPEILKGSLSKFREKGIIGISSGVSDPYQPIESSEKLMTACAKIISSYSYPAILFTKSSMVKRDIDIWEEVHKKAGFTLMMSIVYPDDHLRKIFEPGASSIESRLDTLKAFKDRGISVGVLSMPLLPYLTDSKEQMEEMVRQYVEIGVDVVMPGAMTLRPGKNKNTYFDVIREHFPHLLKKYEDLYSENRQSGAPKNYYSDKIHTEYTKIIEKNNIPTMMPHKLYKNRMPIYDEVYILMSHMVSLYDRKNVNVDNLVIAKAGYAKWLTEEKKFFNRRRNLNFESLEYKLINMLGSKNMDGIIDNDRLVDFLREVIINKKVFNYITLKLEDS